MKRFFLLVIIILILISPSHLLAAVAFDAGSGTASVNSADASVATISLTTFTVSVGSNRCLIAVLHTRAAVTNVALSWDSGGTPQSMTSVGTVSGTLAQIYMFRLVAPTEGNLTLTATWTTATVATLGAASFTGTDQTTCVNTTNNNSATGTGTTETVTITGTADGATIAAATNAGGNQTATTQTTVYINSSQAFQDSALSYNLTGLSNAHTWTTVGSPTWAVFGTNIIAASAGGGSGGLLMMGVGK